MATARAEVRPEMNSERTHPGVAYLEGRGIRRERFETHGIELLDPARTRELCGIGVPSIYFQYFDIEGRPRPGVYGLYLYTGRDFVATYEIDEAQAAAIEDAYNAGSVH